MELLKLAEWRHKLGVDDVWWDYLSGWRVKVACAVTGLSAYILIKSVKKYIKYKDLPPGPTALPLLGNLLALKDPKNGFVYLASLNEKYSDIYTFYLGPTPCVILGSQEAVKEAYLDKMNDFADRPKAFSVELSTDGYKSLSMADLSPVWKLQRKIAHNAIRTLASGEKLESLVQVNIDNLVEMFRKENGAAFDPSKKLSLAMYNKLATICFGKVYEEDDEEILTILKMVDELTEEMSSGLMADIFPILKYVPTPTVRKFKRVIKHVHNWIDKFLAEHKEMYDRENLSDLTYMMIKIMEDIEAEEGNTTLSLITQVHLRNMIMDFFFAGTDTTRFTLMYVIYYTILYPDIQAKMCQEIDHVLGNRRVTHSDRSNLHYVEAVLYETMRIRPVAPLGFPRVTGCDTSLRGHRIPKGTMVMMNTWAIHMDTRYWDKPSEFNPDRFLDSEGKFNTKPYSFLPFSTGRRVCVGESLAKVDLFLLITTMYQKMTFEAAPGEKYTDTMDNTADGMACLPKAFKMVAKMRDH